MKASDIILKFALQNSVLHAGKADKNAVLGKILKEMPEEKSNIKKLVADIAKIVSEVNELSFEEQKEKLEQEAPELLEKKKAGKKELAELPNAMHGKVVTRIPPEPSKHLHIGHGLSFIINYMYAKKYDGKCILRFEDTNPAKAEKEYVDSMTKEIKDYLQIVPDKTLIVSNDMEIFYEHAEKLIAKGNAYVCFCSKESISDMRQKGQMCQCRTHSAEKNMEEWKKMLGKKYKEGQAILRLSADMLDENHAMRDPAIFRIITEKHFLQGNKYCVWPLYDFENAVEDGLHGVTHILRSIEFGEMRVELQDYIKSILNMPKQTVVQYGRFNIAGATSKGREIREMIESGEYTGWDDPRLVTLVALRKRCIQVETIRELAVEVGLTASQTNIDFSAIAAINRKILDVKAKRFFFIKDPVKVIIKGTPEHTAEVKYHPTDPSKGSRKYKVYEHFYIEKSDFEDLKEKELVRLMDCLNFRKEKKTLVFDSIEFEKFKGNGKKVIHWLPVESAEKCQVMMPDAKKINGLVEHEATKLKEGDVIQFTRFGFCSMQDPKKQLFWYGHD